MTAQPKYEWGISTLGCHELTLSETCALAEKHGIHVLEIRSLADRQDLPAYLDETYANASEIEATLARHHQRIVALNSGFRLTDAREEDHAELLEFARWAEALRIPYIRAFGGGEMSAPLPKDELDQASKRLQWWKDLRAQNGWTVDLALETHCGFSSGERCLQLLEHSGIAFDVIWDTHHTWKYGGESAARTWEQIAPLIRHVHIKDSVPIPSARHPYSYVLPGTGEFPAEAVLDLLEQHEYEGVVSLEWERKWHPYMPTLDEALTQLVAAGWKKEALATA